MELFRPQDPGERLHWLGQLVWRPEMSSSQHAEALNALLAYAARRGLSLEHVLVAREGGKARGLCLCIDGAGRIGSLLLPASRQYLHDTAAVVALIADAVNSAVGRGMRFVQAISLSEHSPETAVFLQAGLRHIARLLCLERLPALPLRLKERPPPVDWVCYAADRHHAFAAAIEETYQDSLDCVVLNGRRDIEDILASHRAVGVFDPGLWYLGHVDGEAVGVVLLNHIPERWACEVVYMGLRPGWRRRGYGVTLLRHALLKARQAGVALVTLSVDEANTPARRLYARLGFAETGAHDVWMAGPGLQNDSI